MAGSKPTKRGRGSTAELRPAPCTTSAAPRAGRSSGTSRICGGETRDHEEGYGAYSAYMEGDYHLIYTWQTGQLRSTTSAATSASSTTWRRRRPARVRRRPAAFRAAARRRGPATRVPRHENSLPVARRDGRGRPINHEAYRQLNPRIYVRQIFRTPHRRQQTRRATDHARRDRGQNGRGADLAGHSPVDPPQEAAGSPRRG